MTFLRDDGRALFGRQLAVLILGAAALALVPADMPGGKVSGGAWAQTHIGGKGGSGGEHDDDHGDDGNTGGSGGGHSGHDDGHDDGHGGGGGSGGNPGSGAGQGQGSGKGQGNSSGVGGSPVWAREGIPEVELGRLNVARSPDQVLQRAYEEALASLSPEMAGFYSMDINEMINELSNNFANLSYIDSPLQNLALLKDALDGTSVLTSTGEITNSTDTLMAAFLGVASDKNLPITTDTVTAVSTILGTPLSPAAAATLAAKAEAIRIAVLAGHG